MYQKWRNLASDIGLGCGKMAWGLPLENVKVKAPTFQFDLDVQVQHYERLPGETV